LHPRSSAAARWTCCETASRIPASSFSSRTSGPASAPGGETRDADAFASQIRAIPGEILFVKLDAVNVDLSAAGALVMGIQHARVRIDGQDIDDRRGFVDWFVKDGSEWPIRVAVDLQELP